MKDPKPTAVKTCAWCKTVGARVLPILNGERFCSRCLPYAWSGLVHPEFYESNKQLARKRAGKPIEYVTVKRSEIVLARVTVALLLVGIVAITLAALFGGKS
jgi:hypothetical protein